MYFGIYIQGETIQNSISASPKVWGITLVKEILNVDKKYLGNIRNGKNQNVPSRVTRLILGEMDVLPKNLWFK